MIDGVGVRGCIPSGGKGYIIWLLVAVMSRPQIEFVMILRILLVLDQVGQQYIMTTEAKHTYRD